MLADSNAMAQAAARDAGEQVRMARMMAELLLQLLGSLRARLEAGAAVEGLAEETGPSNNQAAAAPGADGALQAAVLQDVAAALNALQQAGAQQQQQP